MNYTENYQLNQWESADKVRREDFNEDNKKLDGAIAGLAGALGGKADTETLMAVQAALPYVKLAEVTAETQCKRIDIDVSQIDLLQYRRIEVDVVFPGGYTGSVIAHIRTNGLSEGYQHREVENHMDYTSDHLGEVGNSICLFQPPRAGVGVQCLFVNMGWVRQAVAPVKWEALETVNLVPTPGGNLPAGTQIRLYGVRR